MTNLSIKGNYKRIYHTGVALLLAILIVGGLYVGVGLVTTQQLTTNSDTAMEARTGKKRARKAVASVADHTAFALGENETPGFPDPFKRHDNKPNYRRTNAKHIRDGLRGIERNLYRNETLREFFKDTLNPKELKGITKFLDDLVEALQNPNSEVYQEIGADLSEELLTMLTRMGYI